MDLPALAATTSSPDSDTPAYYLGCAPSQCRGRFAYASPIHHVDSTDPPMLLVNSDREEMPLSQATRMAGRLHWRHVPHRIILLRGSRHALQYERDVWSRTVAFLGRSLRP
jgi:dipeptidyl aminopeptidase/acylaminoacyl peptidase